MIRRGEVWWADLPEPVGSEPGYRRPVLVISSDRFNSSTIRTVMVASITSNLKRAEVPGNVLIPKRSGRLRTDSVVNVSKVATVDRGRLLRRVMSLPDSLLHEVDEGLRLALEL